MTQSIKHQFFFPHSPESVWEYLTNPELMKLWLMKNNFQPILGFEFEFRTNPIPGLDFDGICYCKVLQIDPYKNLSYSWRSGPGEGNSMLDSVVEWLLMPKDKGTELFLEHKGFSRETNLNMFKGLTDGWLQNIHKIADRLNAAEHGSTKV